MRKILFFLPVLFILLGSCKTQHEKLIRSRDVNLKLTKANEYYASGKWYRANELYQSLIPVMRGTKNFEELSYRYCYTFYYMKDYLSASYQFKNFIEAFPQSTRAEECEFMYASSMYKMVPRYPLDQTVTQKTIAILQSYIDNYPNSPNLTKANNYIDHCRENIETKAAESALLYYNMREYKAATVAYQNLIQNFPISKNNGFYFFMKQKAHFQYAKASIQERQMERYKESIDAFEDFKQYYPQSSYMKEAVALKNDTENRIEKLKKITK